VLLRDPPNGEALPVKTAWTACSIFWTFGEHVVALSRLAHGFIQCPRRVRGTIEDEEV
jgi:hypothetical protein